MNPVAFSIMGFDIRWYGIILATAILTAVLLAMHIAKKDGLSADVISDIALFGIPGGIIGARLYYVLFSWDYYGIHPSEILNIRGGGLAIHGAIIGGVLAGGGYVLYKKLPFWKYADVTATSFILAQAIGRWGNFANQEAHGGPTDLPWGILVHGQKVHPTFLYESLWDLMVFGILMKYRKHRKGDGVLFCMYLALYSVGRFFIEGLRTDSLMLGPLRQAQVLSLGLIIVFGALGVLFHRRGIMAADAAMLESVTMNDVNGENTVETVAEDVKVAIDDDSEKNETPNA